MLLNLLPRKERKRGWRDRGEVRRKEGGRDEDKRERKEAGMNARLFELTAASH